MHSVWQELYRLPPMHYSISDDTLFLEFFVPVHTENLFLLFMFVCTEKKTF